MRGDATLQHFDVIAKRDLVDMQPRYVKVQVLSKFIVGPTSKESFWCEVHLIGSGKKPLTCSVDNEMKFTEDHGIKFGDSMSIFASEVMEVRLK